MDITDFKKGLRKVQRINFSWIIKDYNIETKYTNKIECGKTVVKMLMEPCYVKGKVEGANPFILFDEVEDFNSSGKQFSLIVKHGIKYESSFGFIGPLQLKQRYSASPTMFLDASNYIYFLEMRKNLILDFEIVIASYEYEKKSSFDESKYSKDLQAIFNNNSFCDCEFDVNGTIIKGHKSVIFARAPEFLKAIEEAENKLSIMDCSVDGFNAFLKFLYCGKLTDRTDAIIFEVLSLADAYFVDYLKQFCEEILMNNLNISNANSIFQNAHIYELSDELKKKSFELIQVMFKNINQKLPDEFINDPKYVDNLITLAESLINGLKKKELNNDQAAFIQATPSVKQMKVESAIQKIYKEAESLNDNDQIDIPESAQDYQTDNCDQDADEATEFSLMEDYVQNMSEIIDEELEYAEFAQNVPEMINDRYLDVIIEEDAIISESEQSILDESDQNKTFDVDSENMTSITSINNQGDILDTEDTPKIVNIDVPDMDERDEVEGVVKDDDVTEIQKDMQNIEKFIIQVTDEVGTVIENVYANMENDVKLEGCLGTEDIPENSDESVHVEKLKVDIKIIKDFDELDIGDDDKLSEIADNAQEEV